MRLYYTVTATQETATKAVLALVGTISLPAGTTETAAKEITMAIVTKELVEASLAENKPFE